MRFDPDWRVAPGETLQEWMEDTGTTENRLANMTGLGHATLRSILDGTGQLTAQVAEGLEAATGIKADFWLKLEAAYRRPVE